MFALAINLDISEIIFIALFIRAVPVCSLAYVEIKRHFLCDAAGGGTGSRVEHAVVGRVQVVPRGCLVAVPDKFLKIEHRTLKLNAAASQVSVFLDVGVRVD